MEDKLSLGGLKFQKAMPAQMKAIKEKIHNYHKKEQQPNNFVAILTVFITFMIIKLILL